jgi:bifunctional enzyme CysN/CysC
MVHSNKNNTIPQDIDTFQSPQNMTDPFRFMFCDSMGTGQSTLLDLLLKGSKAVFTDQNSVIRSEIDSHKALHYFATKKRQFIAAYIPDHIQYTDHIVATASLTDAAVIVIDASQGILTASRRHSYMVSLFGIRQIVLVVNKMDLVDYAQNRFDEIVSQFTEFAVQLSFDAIHFVPISLLNGDNVLATQTAASGNDTLNTNMPWYSGSTLIEQLETIPSHSNVKDPRFRLPVQSVNRPSPEFFGFNGRIVSGNINQGMAVIAGLSGRSTKVKKIVGASGEMPSAKSGQAVTLFMEDDIDMGPGDIIAMEDSKPDVADQFAAHIIWMNSNAMLPERTYLIRFFNSDTTARITDLVHRVDTNTLNKLAAKKLGLNEVGYCKLALDKAVAFDAYKDNRQTGAFVLIDQYSDATVGAGMIEFALRRASNIGWHTMKIDKLVRAAVNNQKPCVVWFTGFSGSGKSSIADHLEQKLHEAGKRTYLLDGDNIRFGLNKDLGFTDHDRVENIRRVAEVAKLLVDAGLIVLASFISPFRSERQMARELFSDGEFVEVYVNTPLAICEQRDPKGLYKKARAGELKNFTGIDSDYEPPEQPEVVLKSGEFDADTLADELVEYLVSKGNHSAYS